MKYDPKFIVSVLLLGTLVQPASAQWSQNGSNIVYTLDDVAIGTTAPDPAVVFQVTADASGPLNVAGIRLKNINAPVSPERNLVFSMNNTQSGVDWLFTSFGSQTGQAGNFEIANLGVGNFFTITPTGNIGIGGSHQPLAKLHVQGDIRGNENAGSLRVQTDFGYIAVGPRNASDANFVTDLPRFKFNKQVRITGGVLSSAGGDGDLKLATKGTVRMTLDDVTGFVGIGTSSPQSELAVDGKITAREVEVTADTWADFVFEDDYPLLPLDQLRARIDADGHLPGIPAAEEVMANGIKVGEMQAKLLQKIEELTLYVLELKQDNDTLQQRVTTLESVPGTSGAEG